jgi:hypothetical protein
MHQPSRNCGFRFPPVGYELAQRGFQVRIDVFNGAIEKNMLLTTPHAYEIAVYKYGPSSSCWRLSSIFSDTAHFPRIHSLRLVTESSTHAGSSQNNLASVDESPYREYRSGDQNGTSIYSSGVGTAYSWADIRARRLRRHDIVAL